MLAKGHTEGKEMIRIQGCYMYMINKCGTVGAFLGFKTLTLVVPQCPPDTHSLHAYLRLSCWLYPLARSFSPIYCWGPDKIILPEPFSSIQHPVYIIIRLPYGCSTFQKSTLWNLLDMHAHVRGQFWSMTKEKREQLEKKYFLSELCPFDESDLNSAAANANAGDVQVLKPLKLPPLTYKGRRLFFPPAKLSVSLHVTERVGVSQENKEKVDAKKCCYQPHLCGQWGYTIVPPSHIKPPSVRPEPRAKEAVTAGGMLHEWVSLPDYSGNILRQYLIGPRDWQHIKVSTVPAPIRIPQLVHFALRKVYRELVRQREEKEKLGVPPRMNEKRVFCAREEAKRMNAFGPDVESRLPQTSPSARVIIPASQREKRRGIMNLESAASYFDEMLAQQKILLICLEPDEERVDKMSPCEMTEALTARPIMRCYFNCDLQFATLMTLPACEELEDIYLHTNNYLRRTLEECEHHYPKVRPINPYLDPAYKYSRYAPTYKHFDLTAQ